MKQKKGFIAEFKEFISRGNVIDLAVGLVVGSAFTAIVSSLVNDIIMPLVGFLIGGLNFADYKLVLKQAVGDLPEVAINYGSFINQIVNFLVVAFAVFVMVRTINRFRRKKEEAPAAPPAPPEDVALLKEIRDLLKEK